MVTQRVGGVERKSPRLPCKIWDLSNCGNAVNSDNRRGLTVSQQHGAYTGVRWVLRAWQGEWSGQQWQAVTQTGLTSVKLRFWRERSRGSHLKQWNTLVKEKNSGVLGT